MLKWAWAKTNTKRKSSSTKMPNQDLLCEKGLRFCSWQNFFAYINLLKTFFLPLSRQEHKAKYFELADVFAFLSDCPFQPNEKKKRSFYVFPLFLPLIWVKVISYLARSGFRIASLNNVHMTYYNDKYEEMEVITLTQFPFRRDQAALQLPSVKQARSFEESFKMSNSDAPFRSRNHWN